MMFYWPSSQTFIHNIENTRHVNYVGSCGMLWPTKSSVSIGVTNRPKRPAWKLMWLQKPTWWEVFPRINCPPPPQQKESLGDNQRQVILRLSFTVLFPRTKEIVNKIVFPSSIILLSHPQSVLIKWLPMIPLRGVISDCASEIRFYLPIKPRPLWVIPIRNKGHQDEVSYFHLNARARASLN